jgi:hypothetical protein
MKRMNREHGCEFSTYESACITRKMREVFPQIIQKSTTFIASLAFLLVCSAGEGFARSTAPVSSATIAENGYDENAQAETLLKTFSGSRRDNGIVSLAWVTAQEAGNARFEILRSEDGIYFESVGEVITLAPYGHSSTPIAYAFTDEKPLTMQTGIVEYQLKIIDAAGESSLSEIVKIGGKRAKQIIIENGLSVFPNPGSSRFNVQISNASEGALLTVSGPTGDILYMYRFPAAVAGRSVTAVDLGDVPGGTYFVRFSSPSGYQESVMMLIQEQGGLASN